MKFPDWDSIYGDALAIEILRSERRRVTILSVLFAVAASTYTFFSFVPGFLADEFRVRLQAQWPWIISLQGVMIADELASRFRVGRLIA